jgi:hypothetical protein
MPYLLFNESAGDYGDKHRVDMYGCDVTTKPSDMAKRRHKLGNRDN